MSKRPNIDILFKIPFTSHYLSRNVDKHIGLCLVKKTGEGYRTRYYYTDSTGTVWRVGE